MASWVEIANKGLRRLGAAPIQDLTDQTEQARAVNDVYQMVRDEVLARHPWNCALKRAQLAADVATPVWGWARQFTLPADCLRIWRLEYTDIEYKVEGGKVLTDASSPLNVIYIQRVTDPQIYPPYLASVMAAHIGAEIAYRLTNSTSKEEAMREAAEMELRHGRSLDSQEGTPEPIEADTFLVVRY